jgi:hypothetical protein
MPLNALAFISETGLPNNNHPFKTKYINSGKMGDKRYIN